MAGRKDFRDTYKTPDGSSCLIMPLLLTKVYTWQTSPKNYWHATADEHNTLSAGPPQCAGCCMSGVCCVD
ncbi:unnamed protein product [Arctogadus glacialis]